MRNWRGTCFSIAAWVCSLKLIIPGLMLGYLIFPVDLLPDFIPVLGQLDDLAILALGIKIFIEVCPKDIVREYRGEWASASSADPRAERQW